MSEFASDGPTRRRVLGIAGTLGAALVSDARLATAQAPQAEAPARSITEVRPNVFRTQDDRHCGLLVATDDGVIVFDTLNLAFAQWLDAEIAKRFSKPVRYVVYSHNHADHVSGGQAFAAHNPAYISHALARDSMVRTKLDTRLPDTTFDDRYDIALGGTNVSLRYHGPNDGRGSISFLVREQRVLSAADWLVIGRLPYRDLARMTIDGAIRSLQEVDGMAFDVAAPGHADIGGKDGIAVFRRYLETLRDQVMAGIVAKEPIETLLPKVRAALAAVPEFASLKQFDAWVDLNIRGAHAQLARLEGFMDG